MKVFKVILILYVLLFCQPRVYSQVTDDQGVNQDARQIPQQGSDQGAGGGTEQNVQQSGGQTEVIPSLPLLEIKRLETKEPYSYSIELRDVELSDFFRVVAHDYNMNILVDKDVSGTISASLTNTSLEEALEAITEMNNLVLETKGKIFIVKPHFITKTFILQHVEAGSLLETASSGSAAGGTAAAAGASGDTGGGAAVTTDASAGAAAGTGTAGASTGGTTSGAAAQASTIYDLLSDKGKVLLGKKTNSLTVIDYPKNVEIVESYLQTIDRSVVGKVFKLKYINARDVSGGTAESSEASSSSEASGEAAASTSDSASQSTESGGE